jgi:hypothetical protein
LRKLEIGSSSLYISTIDTTNINKELCTIIQKQNNLKAIILSSYYSSPLNNTLLSLESQKHSLIYIEFKNINFSNVTFKNFINLCNLKYLIFYDCDSRMMSLDQCDVLKYASFKLKRLEFKNRGWGTIKWKNDLVTSLMIKYLGTSLQELILSDESNISIIENISTYCSNLIKLQIKVELEPESLLIIPYLKNLKIGILNIINYQKLLFSLNVNNYGVLKSLASNLPTDLKEISICNHFLSCFKEFLENCHHCLEVINLSYSIKLELLKIILNYIKRSNNSSLKVLGMTKLDKLLNYEELELLNQIKAEGVKIVDFYSIFNHDDSLSFV